MRFIVPGPPHAGVLAALHGACFASGWDETSFAELIATAGSVAWLALEQEQPVGLVLGRIVAGEGEILTLAVLPEARRRGLARLLLNRTLDAASDAGCRMMFLEVAASNAPALRLYRDAGFREIGRRREYYRSSDGKGEDAFVMRKDL